MAVLPNPLNAPTPNAGRMFFASMLGPWRPADNHGQEHTKFLHLVIHLLWGQIKGHAIFDALQQLLDLLDLMMMGEQYSVIARQLGVYQSDTGHSFAAARWSLTA